MTEDIEFLRSMAAACRKEARAERRRRPREELMLFAERMDSIATRCAHLVAIGKKHAPMEATLYLSSAQRVPGKGNPMETRYVRVARFTELTGYTDDAVRSKIQAGDWLEGREFRKAPDGRILIDLQGYERWVEHQHATAASAPRRRRQSRSTSTGGAHAAANG